MSRARRLHILIVFVFEDGLDVIARGGVVFVEFQVILTAVQDADVDAFVVGVPGDGGEVLLSGFARLNDDFFSRLHVVDVQRHLMTRHAGHRVFDGLGRGDALCDVDQRIVGHHAFIHGVIGQLAAVGRPKDAAIDGELVAVNTLTGDHAFGVVGDLYLLVAIGHIKVVLDGIGDTHGRLTDGVVFSILWQRRYRCDALFLQVKAVETDAVFTQAIEISLVAVNPSEVGYATQTVDARLVGIAIEYVESQEGRFLVLTGFHGDDIFAIHFHQ